MKLVGYTRVHQGGHHDVWCNNETHIYPLYGGGFCHPAIEVGDIVFIKRVGVCNCKDYIEQLESKL